MRKKYYTLKIDYISDEIKIHVPEMVVSVTAIPDQLSNSIAIKYCCGSSEDTDILKPIWDWCGLFYKIAEKEFPDTKDVIEAAKFSKAVLQLYEGYNPTEIWEFQGFWPKSVDFGDLSFSPYDETELEFVMMFSSFEHKIISFQIPELPNIPFPPLKIPENIASNY